MSDWQGSGYVTEAGYTFGYYPELSPIRAQLMLTAAGIACPHIQVACELGFGQGVSIGIHAAASDAQWHGTDFNPEHVAQARELAQAAGVRMHVEEDDFAAFAARGDLPDFDFIALHGVWSWISPEHRRTLTGFIDRRLKPGGVVYASYNTLPGWGPVLSLRQWMLRHSTFLDAPAQPIAQRIERAAASARALQSVAPGFGAIPGQKDGAIGELAGQDLRYLAHEYFNRDWHPMHFDEIAAELAAAKLQFACGANALEHVPALELSAEQQAFLARYPDTVTRELAKDIMLDRKFRRDYWVKGPRGLDPRARRHRLLQTRFVPLAAPGAEKARLPLTRGELTLKPETTAALLELLRTSPEPLSLAQIERSGVGGSLGFDALVQTLLLQVQAGNLAVAQNDAAIEHARAPCAALNASILAQAVTGAPVRHLASPVIGGGVPVDRLVCLLLAARGSGATTAPALAQHVWAQLSAVGEQVTHAGKAIEGEAQSLAHLSRIAGDFLERGVPTFARLGLA